MALTPAQREAAIAQVERFCEQRTPRDVRDQMRLEYETSGAKITIVERRAPWNPELGSDWSTQPIAQLRHDAATDAWALYWPRHTGRWHRYEDARPAPDVASLLAEIDADPDGAFWG